MKIDTLKRKIVEDLRNLNKNESMISVMALYDRDVPVLKDAKLSVAAKSKGNKLYSENSSKAAQQHKVLHFYNESIALAPLGSEEQAASFGNKSAILRRMRKYSECICEADKALKIAKGLSLKVKLLCRKAECFTALGSPESKGCLKKARYLLSKSKDPKKIRDLLNELVDSTETFVNEGKVEKIKEDKRKILALKMIADSEKENIWNLVRVEYSEKYGRHLVAARDFEPGDIVMVEKPYRTYLQDTLVYQYCYNCMHYLWTAVPCNHCSWCLFCSEECRDEAWNEFHDGECYLIARIYASQGVELCQRISLVLSTFFKALKEAGSLKKLQADIEEIDELGDEYVEDLQKDEKLANYKSIFCFPARNNLNRDELNTCIWRASTALLFLSKWTSVLGKNYNFNEMKKLAQDDKALFIGAYMLKINMITASRYIPFSLPDPAEQGLARPEDPINAFLANIYGKPTGPQIKNFTFKSSTALTTFGCIPNVGSSVSYSNKYTMTALQPIKEGTKLICYLSSNVFSYGSKAERMMTYKQHYTTPCECQACVEDWSFDDMTRQRNIRMTQAKFDLIDELEDEVDTILAEREFNSHKLSYPDMEMISRVKLLAARAWENLDMPSSTMIKSVQTMLRVIWDLLTPADFRDAKE